MVNICLFSFIYQFNAAR